MFQQLWSWMYYHEVDGLGCCMDVTLLYGWSPIAGIQFTASAHRDSALLSSSLLCFCCRCQRRSSGVSSDGTASARYGCA